MFYSFFIDLFSKEGREGKVTEKNGSSVPSPFGRRCREAMDEGAQLVTLIK